MRLGPRTNYRFVSQVRDSHSTGIDAIALLIQHLTDIFITFAASPVGTVSAAKLSPVDLMKVLLVNIILLTKDK